jgi:hypothetical protein
VLHPDKNKAPGSQKAFQALKKAFDAVMSGVDPDAKDTAKVGYLFVVSYITRSIALIQSVVQLSTFKKIDCLKSTKDQT